MAAILLLLTSIAPIPGDSSKTTGDEVGPESWLMLVYMAADNNLGENASYGNAAWFDLEEMEGNMSSGDLTILVLNDMKGDHNTRLYNLTNHPPPGIGSPTIPLSEVNPQWGDELKTSDWKVLRDFIVYGINTGEHDRIMLDIWDHGTGWYRSISTRSPQTRGFAQDVTDGGTMYLDDLRRALSGAESEIGSLEMDIIAFDTCYMSTIEVMYQVSPWANYGLGAQDQQPFYGMNYTYTSQMGYNASLTPESLVSMAVEVYSGTYDVSSDPWAGLSAVDLRSLRYNLTPSLDRLARNITGRMYHLEVERQGAFYQAHVLAERIGGSYKRIDLGDLLYWINERNLDDTITSLSKDALLIYNDTIVNEYHMTNGNNQGATGLTVYFPGQGYNPKYNGSSGFLNFTADTWWDELVWEFQDPRERVRINSTVVEMDGDGLKNDLIINVTNTFHSPVEPVIGAEVFLDDKLKGYTDINGIYSIENLSPDRYDLRVENGTWIGYAEVKMQNRPPVIVIHSEGFVFHEYETFTLDASGSFDPDGDDISFRWDLNGSNGLDDTDSTDPQVTLNYEGEGNHTLSLRVSDGITQVREELNLSIVNRAPQARLRVPVTAREDEVFIMDARGTVDSPGDSEHLIYSFFIDGDTVADGSPVPFLETSISTKGTHKLEVRVTDPQGGVGINSTTLDVYNVWPHPEISGLTSAEEDQKVMLMETGDPDTESDLPYLKYEWFLDGVAAGENESSLEIKIGESGRHNVTLVVSDDDGNIGEAWHDITVTNVPPEAAISGPASSPEGETVTFNADGSSDTPSDMETLRYEWDLDSDGDYEIAGWSVEHEFLKAGTYSVRLRVTDDDGGYDTSALDVVVTNLPPNPIVTGPKKINEDEFVNYTLEQFPDTPGDIDTLSYSWYLDGMKISGEKSASLSIGSSGKHTIQVSVVDDQGDEGWDTYVVDVENVPPTARIIIPSKNVRTGEEFQLLGWRSTDTSSDLSTLAFEWFLNGRSLSSNEANLTLSIDREGEHHLALKVTDDDGISHRTEIVMSVAAYEEESDESRSLALFLLIGGPLIVVTVGIILGIRRKVDDLPTTPEERFDGEVMDDEQEPGVSEGATEEEPGVEELDPSQGEIGEDPPVPADDEELNRMGDEELEEIMGEGPEIPPPPEISEPDGEIFTSPPVSQSIGLIEKDNNRSRQ